MCMQNLMSNPETPNFQKLRVFMMLILKVRALFHYLYLWGRRHEAVAFKLQPKRHLHNR